MLNSGIHRSRFFRLSSSHRILGYLLKFRNYTVYQLKPRSIHRFHYSQGRTSVLNFGTHRSLSSHHYSSRRIPECPRALAKREGLFKHPVLIKHEPPEYLFPAGGVAFSHHIQRRIKEIEPLLVFPGIQNSYTLPPVLVESGDRSFPCPCMFSDDCICHGNYSPEIRWFPNDFSLIEKYFALRSYIRQPVKAPVMSYFPCSKKRTISGQQFIDLPAMPFITMHGGVKISQER